VNVPDEINEIFDTISYQKGGSVIRMMANFLQIQTFNRGITNYLHSNAYGNANQDTLWEYLTDAAIMDGTIVEGLTVKDIMDTWTLQMGYPVVSVERNYAGAAGEVQFHQERFLINPKAAANATAEDPVYRWWVPLSVAVAGDLASFENTTASLWMSPTDAGGQLSATLPGVDAAAAIIVNVKQTGFYRVNYDDTNWQRLADHLAKDHSAIHRMNRAQLLDDAFNLARAGRLEYPTALALTDYLSKELDYIPWTAALNGFAYIETMFKRSAGFGDFRSYLTGALQPVYDRLGFEERPGEDSILDSKLRVKVLRKLCNLNHPECTETSVRLFAEWMSSSDPDAASPIPRNFSNYDNTPFKDCFSIRVLHRFEFDCYILMYVDQEYFYSIQLF
jgi:aminopeptidase N